MDPAYRGSLRLIPESHESVTVRNFTAGSVRASRALRRDRLQTALFVHDSQSGERENPHDSPRPKRSRPGVSRGLNVEYGLTPPPQELFWKLIELQGVWTINPALRKPFENPIFAGQIGHDWITDRPIPWGVGPRPKTVVFVPSGTHHGSPPPAPDGPEGRHMTAK